MTTTYKARFYNEPKENDLKYNYNGQAKILLICLNYQGTESPLTCLVDGKRLIKEAKLAGVTQIVALFDDGSTDLFPNRKNVINKMAEMAASCLIGDYFVVYYSGHGISVQDVNKDEIDGFDQAFCLMSQSGAYEFLTDDDASQCIAKNLPDNVPCLFVVDACHSGTILDLTKDAIWKNKKVFCMSGCQDNQYSNDTGNGGQMTNVLLAVIRQHQHKRESKQVSIQHIFNRMVKKNQEIEGNYDETNKDEAYKDLQASTGQSFIAMCFSAFEICKGKENIQSNANYFEMVEGFVNYDDQPGQFPSDQDQDKTQPGQWINLSWCGGSDPTKLPFPF